MAESIGRDLGSDDLSRFSQQGEAELKLEDLADLVPPEKSAELEQPGELTPQKVAQVWDGLSDLERKFVLSEDAKFDGIIQKYTDVRGEKRTLVLKALRKLIQSHDPRAALIDPDFKKAA